MERRLFILQRLTAMVMAPFVLVHLGLIIYAVRSSLTAQALLARTHGNWAWITFYGLFVLAVSVHAPIGVRNILVEWAKFSRPAATVVAAVFGATLFVMGFRAVAAVGGFMP